MGALASELVRLSGPDAVHGIIPNALQAHERKNEIAEKGEKEQKKIDEAKYGKTTVVADMHTRKKTMTDAVLAGGPGSGFVALSGGYGTLEELMEVSFVVMQASCWKRITD
jgi:predicted Rossmann-fold nucleotide-binding protein